MDSPPLSDRLTASEQDESYSALLEEIQELQTKLHRSTSMVEKMSRDSEQFRCQYEQSQVELEQSRKKLRESKDALCNQVKITCMREKEIGILESRWKKTVGAERQDIVSARGELEIMANVRENVEKEFECQLDKLKEVVSRSRSIQPFSCMPAVKNEYCRHFLSAAACTPLLVLIHSTVLLLVLIILATCSSFRDDP